MSQSQALRIEPRSDGVRIWSEQIFGAAQASTLREFLARAFSVAEVEGVELQLGAAFGRIAYRALSKPAPILKKLSKALRGPTSTHNGNGSKPKPQPGAAIDVSSVYLEGTKVRVSRIGTALTTWHVRAHSERSLQLFHPRLRGNRAMLFRLEEELAATYGVETYRVSELTGTVYVSFDAGLLSSARLVVQLEKAWPRLLEGLEPPPPRTRFLAASGVLGLAFTGQFLVPALRPAAVLSAALYSSPNVVGAVKDLKRGEVGLYAMYSTGLAFMLYSGMPFASGLFATFSQLWPSLARDKLVRSQRRLFAEQRRRPAWVRIARADGTELEVHIDAVKRDDRVLVRRGEMVPVDGVVIEGFAALVLPAALGGRIEDVTQGERAFTGSVLREGSLTVRVERTAAETLTASIDAWLPHAVIKDMPSALEAERIGNRNAKPALLLSLTNLALTRTLRVSQVLIRPDYVTAPRLSVQLSALHALAQGLQEGVLFKRPAAIDRLADAEVFVLDDSVDLARPQLAVSDVETSPGVSIEELLQYALTAQPQLSGEQRHALELARKSSSLQPLAVLVGRFVGVSRFRDTAGASIEVASSQYLVTNKIQVPRNFAALTNHAQDANSSAQRLLWVLRNGQVIGRIAFDASGGPLGLPLIAAIKAQRPRARIVYASSARDADAKALAAHTGITLAYGGLSAASKAQLIRDTPNASVWIGDGTQPGARESLQASAASISLTPAARLRADADAADVLLAGGEVDQLAAALALSSGHRARLTRDYRALYGVNLLGVVGGVVARATSLQAGLLTNAGTWFIYARHARALDKLAAQAEDKRLRLTRALHP